MSRMVEECSNYSSKLCYFTVYNFWPTLSPTDIINMKTIMNNFENTISEIIVDAMKSSPQINNIDQEQLVNLIINMLCADINVRPEPEDIYINVQKILTIQGI